MQAKLVCKWSCWVALALLGVSCSKDDPISKSEPPAPNPVVTPDPTPEPEEQVDERQLKGTWYLGLLRMGKNIMHFDGTEYMKFEGNTLTWGGRQDGTETYTLLYNTEYTSFVATSQLHVGKVEGFDIETATDQILALSMGEIIRYFYPTPELARDAALELDEDEMLKPAPTHTETTDIQQIVNMANYFTHSELTPMGRHFEGARQATETELAWLNNPQANPSPVADLVAWQEKKVNLYPFGNPLPADVNQHNIGDCSACAVLASLAYMYPGFIQHILTDHGDGTYTVAMYNPQGQPVQVSVNSQFLCTPGGDIGQVTGKNNEATWSTILEKALLKWEEVYQVDGIVGIGSEHVAPLFTGCGDSFAYAPNTLWGSELALAVKHYLNQGNLIIGGFDEDNLPCGKLYSVTAHAFTLMYPSHADCLFSMRNPWGIESVDGVLTIPDQRRVTQAIDIRVILPGAAAPYLNPNLGPYQPPVFQAGAREIGVHYRMHNRLFQVKSISGR